MQLALLTSFFPITRLTSQFWTHLEAKNRRRSDFGREKDRIIVSQTRCANGAATRDHGTEGQNNPAQRGGLEAKKKSGRRRSVFFSTPFIELLRR
jgi:hypothetical protein